MRMWNVNPKVMCRKHLLGEHVEMHMFLGTIKKKSSIKGYIDTGLVEVHNIIKRHDIIANEMKKRGYKHQSPSINLKLFRAGKVDKELNVLELARRCIDCRARISFNINKGF